MVEKRARGESKDEERKGREGRGEEQEKEQENTHGVTSERPTHRNRTSLTVAPLAAARDDCKAADD